MQGATPLPLRVVLHEGLGNNGLIQQAQSSSYSPTSKYFTTLADMGTR